VRRTGAALAGALALLALAGAAAAAIPTSTLALMVLPKSALGAGASSLRVDAAGSGVRTNADAAEDSIDTADTATSLARAGRLTGYQLSYGDPSLSALTRGAGLLEIDSEVELFRGADAVAAAIGKDLRDFRRYEGKVVSGVRLERVQTFPVAGLGPPALGARLEASIGGKRLWISGVEFRLGALEGSVTISRADANDESARAVALARALERRMRGVLAGTVTGKPVAIPKKQPPGTTATRPPGSPDLSRAMLRPADLPAGTTTTKSAYSRVSGAVAAYTRAFAPKGRLPGGTRLISLQEEVSLYTSADRASIVLAGVEGVFGRAGSAEFARFFAQRFKEGAGFEPTSLSVVRNRRLQAGDRAREVAVRIGTPLGRVEASFVFVRSGRLLGWLYAAASPGARLTAGDGERLARTAAARMRAARL
jgi:hypothetical protein